MKIKKKNLIEWKKKTLDLAGEMAFDPKILKRLEDIELEIIPEDSNHMFYGWANYGENKIKVYESNPSKIFPRRIQEIWNQSGMDHELMGHFYNFYNGLDHGEANAIETQMNFARYKGKKDILWKVASFVGPSVIKLKG